MGSGGTGRDHRIYDFIYIGTIMDGNNVAGNHDVTNVKVWVGSGIAASFTSAALFAEMNSESAVITANLYAHWKLPSISDLTDSSGNSRTITAAASATSGSMDPVDLQPPSPPSRTVITGLRITH